MEKPTPEQINWVLKHVVDHFEQGGSYRYLIYDRFGFKPEDGVYPLLLRNGMALTNIAHDYHQYQEKYGPISDPEYVSMYSTKELVQTYGAKSILHNAISMLVDEISDKNYPTQNERYLLEAWEEYCKSDKREEEK